MIKKEKLIYIILLGSMWGIIEATLGMFLHLIHLKGSGAVLAGIGMCFMYTGWKYGGKKMPISIAVTAASFKMFDSIFLGIPFFSAIIFNPTTAIILEGLLFNGAVYIITKKVKNTPYIQKIILSSSASIVCTFCYLKSLLLHQNSELFFLLPNLFYPLIIGLISFTLIDYLSVYKFNLFKNNYVKIGTAILLYLSAIITNILLI